MTQRLTAAFLVVYPPSTQAAYRRQLTDAFDWLKRAGTSPLAATRWDLEGYRAACTERGLSAGTVAGRLSTLVGWYQIAVQDGLLRQSPMDQVRRPRPARRSPFRSLDAAEIGRLLAAAADHSLRAHALVAAMCFTGLRVSAWSEALVEDLQPGRPWTLTYRNKGSGRRVTVLVEPVVTALQAYLGDRRAGPVFRSRTGRVLDRTSATRLVQRVGAVALPERDVTCHLLRASFTGIALRAGVPVQQVGAALGHADPVTTVLHYDRERRALEEHPAFTVAHAVLS